MTIWTRSRNASDQGWLPRVRFDGSGTPGYPKPWLSEKILGHRFFVGILFCHQWGASGISGAENFLIESGKRDLQFGSGPRPSNKQDSWVSVIFLFEICFCIFLGGIKIRCKLGREGSGEFEFGSKWSDGLSERFEMFSSPKLLWKNNDKKWLSIFSFNFMVLPGNKGFG